MFGFTSLESLLLAALTVGIGALIQGCIGFGLSLWSAPFLLLIDARLVPGSLLLATMVHIVGSAWREREAIDLRGVGWVLGGRLPGTFAGALLLAALSRSVLSILLGGLVLLAVGMSLLRARFERTRPLLLGAGFVSGVMGTIAALGGPSIAVLYQHEQGPKIRATLAAVFAAGASMSLVGMIWVGRLGATEIQLAVPLVPAVIVGLLASNPLLGRLPARRMRKAVLVIAAAGGVLAIAQGVRS